MRNKATVSPHMTFVIGRRMSTPAASRTTSPIWILPRRSTLVVGSSASVTDKTRTVPSEPRFSFNPNASEMQVTVRSGPQRSGIFNASGDCFGHSLGMVRAGGVVACCCIASSRGTNRGGGNFGTTVDVEPPPMDVLDKYERFGDDSFPASFKLDSSSSNARCAFSKYA